MHRCITCPARHSEAGDPMSMRVRLSPREVDPQLAAVY